MTTKNKTKITSYVKCLVPGDGAQEDHVYATTGLVLNENGEMCYYLLNLEKPLPETRFVIDAVVSNK